MNVPNEPNVRPEDNPQPQGEGEPEYFDVAADDDEVMPALEVPPVGDPEESDDTEQDLNETFNARLQAMEREYQARMERALRDFDAATRVTSRARLVLDPNDTLVKQFKLRWFLRL